MCTKTGLIGILLCLSMGFLHAQSAGFEELKSLELIDQIYEHLDQYFVDEIEHGKLSKTAIDAMLNALDPYTVFYHEANIEDYRLMTTGQYGGIGATVGNIENNPCITELFEKGPAQLGGLLVGDKLLRVDNKSTAQKSLDEVSNALKGPKGTSVTLEVERGGKTINVKIARDEIKLADIPYAGLIDAKTGYIALSSFTPTAGEEVKKNLLALQSQGMDKLIFDLRGNGGGLLMEAVKIVGFFVPKGQLVVSTKGRSKQENMEYKTQEAPISENLKLVVLIDENSASASEIVAGSLQDLDRAIIVGSTSYGKGLVQRSFDLKYGSKMKLTIAKYYTPSGRCVQRLEYYDHKNGEDAQEIPDSLLQQFKTKNGRTVIDGRGIEPDIRWLDSISNDFCKALLVQHMIFHFATQYHATHATLDSAEKFKLSMTEFQDFQTFVGSKNFQYRSYEEQLLEKLQASMEKKKEFSAVSTPFTQLKNSIHVPLNTQFERNKKEIISMLEAEIVSRYYFEKGRNVYRFKNSAVIKKVLNLLANESEYQSILNKK